MACASQIFLFPLCFDGFKDFLPDGTAVAKGTPNGSKGEPEQKLKERFYGKSFRD
jgi:hypothetical protein